MTYTGVYPERSRRDGDGRRVQKSSGTLYWYGGGSDVLYETDLSGGNGRDYIFFGGRRLARYDETPQTIYHYFEDHLGSSRVIVQSTTNTPCYDADFGPYGKEAVYTNTCSQNYKFTSKERDTETGNDNFGARYYENNLGRFTSADWSAEPEPVPYANFTDPQSLNLYGYVRNNPLSHADADGHCCTEEATETIEDLASPKAVNAALNGMEAAAKSGAVEDVGGSAVGASLGAVGLFVVGVISSPTVLSNKEEADWEAASAQRQQLAKEGDQSTSEKKVEPKADGAGAQKGGGPKEGQNTSGQTGPT